MRYVQPYFPKELTIQSIYDIMQLNQKGYYMYSFELLVVHCIKEGGTIRIISSRKATAAERRGYENLRIKL